MITRRELDGAITECENAPTTYQNCEKLATFYTIREHAFKKEGTELEYSYDPPQGIGNFGDSDFLQAVKGRDETEIWSILDELMDTVLNKPWDDTYIYLAVQGFKMKDMPSSNRVWGEFLYANGFRRFIIPDSCPNCYTIKDFCEEHKDGKYILATGTHVVCVVDGNYYDSWDSGDEIPIYYWRKEK